MKQMKKLGRKAYEESDGELGRFFTLMASIEGRAEGDADRERAKSILFPGGSTSRSRIVRYPILLILLSETLPTKPWPFRITGEAQNAAMDGDLLKVIFVNTEHSIIALTLVIEKYPFSEMENSGDGRKAIDG